MGKKERQRRKEGIFIRTASSKRKNGRRGYVEQKVLVGSRNLERRRWKCIEEHMGRIFNVQICGQ
jgi:hypothetical protein